MAVFFAFCIFQNTDPTNSDGHKPN